MEDISQSTSSTLAQVNQDWAEYFSRDRSTDYDSVGCLLFTWKEADHEGYKTEALALRDFFRTRLNYRATHYEIPSHQCQHAVRVKLLEFLGTLMSTKKSLAIIFYGGHGDKDTTLDEDGRRPRRGVWARTGRRLSQDEVVNWSDIQTSLGEFTGDVFVLLDCCYAAQAGRTSQGIIPPNVELQAACAMGLTTPLPGRWSFSTKWLEVGNEMLDEKGYIVISETHHALGNRNNQLAETPQYSPLQRGKGTIRLDPLPSIQIANGKQSLGAAILELKVIARGPADDNLFEEIHEWVKTYAPRRVLSIEATQLALDLRDFIAPSGTGSRSSTVIKDLDEPSRRNIQNAWSTLTSWVSGAAKSMSSNLSIDWASGEVTDELKVDSFLKELDSNIQAVQRLIERGLTTLPALQEQEPLLQALRDPDLQKLGVTESLRIKFLSKFIQHEDYSLQESCSRSQGSREPVGHIPLIEANHPTYGQILVEYKRYDSSTGDRHREDCERRINRLAGILRSAHPSTFHTPNCLGWFHEPKLSRFALMFAKPQPDRHLPITLRQIIDSHHERADTKKLETLRRPSLAERFEIARKLCHAILKWHTTGWVHQGIGSFNVVFLHNQEGSVQYDEPYLCGFEFSRRHSDLSRDKNLYHSDFQTYLHPERQGELPEYRHTKKHDIYSFGLLLAEIAAWDTIPALFENSISRRGIKAVQKLVINYMRGLLSHTMGEAYEAAVMLCLKGNFEAVVDDEDTKLELVGEFEKRVLGRLNADPTQNGIITTH